MSSQQQQLHQMLPPAALTDALEKARNGGGGGNSNSNSIASVRDPDGPLSPHPPARAVQLSRSMHRNRPASGEPSFAASAAAAAAGGPLASPPPAPPPTPIGPVGGRPVIDDNGSNTAGNIGSNRLVGGGDGKGSALPPMLKLGATAAASTSASSASTSAASGTKLGSGRIGTACSNSSSSAGRSTMPPPPSDLLSRLDAFLPQLAKANQDLLSKTTPTDGNNMEVEASNGDNETEGGGGEKAAAASCCASAAVASLQIDADMVQCGDSSDSDGSDDSASESESDSDDDSDNDQAEVGGPPTIEMSIALGPFGGDVGPKTDAARMVEDGDGVDGSTPSGGGYIDKKGTNIDIIPAPQHSEQEGLGQQQQQQPKKRKVLIEEISSSSSG